MQRIYSLNDALLLLKEHYTLLCKPYGQKEILYTLNDDKVLIQNKNFKSFITLEQFKEDFENHPFYIIEIEEKDEEIDQTHIVWRQ